MQTPIPSSVPPPALRPVEVADDLSLLRRSARDDGEAFDELFARHRDGLQGFLYRKLQSHEEAEDAVTLTFCNAWRARSSFRGGASGKAWLYQIATRVALDMLRRRRRRPVEQELNTHEPDQLHALGTDAVDPEDLLLDTERAIEMKSAVNSAIRRLSPEEQRLLRLFYYEGRSYDEISESLGVTRSQVRGRLHRIRYRVRQDLVERQRYLPA